MKIVGLTGGIGSGKTTVANFFEDLGAPVYIADKEAKRLMESDEELHKKLVDFFGRGVYHRGRLNRKYLAGIVFKNAEKLQLLNSWVHPAVAHDFRLWVSRQHAPYVIKETALLFETGDYKNCDFSILVIAPLEDRIKRVMARDLVSRDEVLSRISNQWSDEVKENLATYVINNTDTLLTKKIVYNINVKIINNI